MGDFFISTDTLERLVGAPDAPILIDVCRAAIYVEHDRILPTAQWRDHLAVEVWAAGLPSDAHVVVNCVHGHNVSQLAVSNLREMGIDAQCLEGGIHGWIAARKPTIRKQALPGRHEAGPSVWVTGIQPGVDRIAGAWLIRRFIDREARFLFVSPDHVADIADELGAVPFGMETVAIGEAGDMCNFDALLSEFDLTDTAARALAPIVRGADTGRLDLAPEAAGLDAALCGISALAGDECSQALRHGFALCDALYAWRKFAARDHHARRAAQSERDIR